jgi:hypothetical protein
MRCAPKGSAMLSPHDKAHFEQHGWARMEGAVPRALCDAAVTALERERGVPIQDPARWPEHLGPMRDLVPIWGHQALWDIRQLPRLHAIWSALWGTEALLVSLHSCRFTPPWPPDAAVEPWPPARLTPPGRRLLGLDTWPSA